MVTIELLDTVPEMLRVKDPCECGWESDYTRCGGSGYYDISHRRWWHPRYMHGVALPKGKELHGIAVIPSWREHPFFEATYTMARLFQRHGHYDFPSFPSQLRHGGREWKKSGTKAYVMGNGTHLIGLATASLHTSIWQVFWDSGLPPEKILSDLTRPTIDAIFVAKEHRRQGVARALVGSIAQDHGIGISDVAYYMPFSDEGKILARSLTGAFYWAH